MFENLLLGFSEIFGLGPILVLALGVLLGLIVGATPGINDTITMVILIPITFGMVPNMAFPLLIGVYVAACYGGSIPAILLKIPGTVSSIITSIDGSALAAKGEQELAIGIATYSSVFGGIMSSLVLIFIAPFLATQALRFGPPEYFALGILGMATTSSMAKDVKKGLIVSVLALLFSTIGLSQQLGFYRFGFGTFYFMDGIPLIPAMIGLFGVSSIFEASSTNLVNEFDISIDSTKRKTIDTKKVFLKSKMIKRLMPTWIASGIIGNIIGIIPGAGMTMGTFVSYNYAKNMNPKEEFGTGVPEGIAAPEVANNAVVASSMVPLLSLGIPGNGTSAIFIGALMIQGLRPGPLLFRDNPEVVYMIIAGFLIANLFMGPFGLILGRGLATALIKIPRAVLSGFVIGICATSCYAINNNIEDLWIMTFFGALCYFLKKNGYPSAPIILGIILGPMIENSLWQSLVMSSGSITIFFTRPLCLFILIIGIILFTLPFFMYKRVK
jgi:putative tricarboxylic transport membrane protein